MKCKNCGSEIREGAVFCAACGSRQLVEGLRSEHELSFTDAPIDTRAEVLKPKKKSGGCCGCLFNLVFFILVIMGIILFIGWYREYSYNKLVQESLLVDKTGIKELNESEKRQDWNNDGISNEEAEQIGLNITVMDSDGDGLSDKDEINKYKTNPVKYSTTGDIYSDGQKVALGYNLTKRYETFDILETPNPMLKVEIDNAHDMRFYYKEYKGMVPAGYYLGFQPFRLFSFSGEVDVEMDDPNKYQVISYDLITNEVKKISSKVENSNLVFTVRNDNPILITYKDSVIKEMNDSELTEVSSKFTNEIRKEYYVVAIPAMTYLFNQPAYVFEMDNKTVKGESNEDLVKEINGKANEKFRIKHYYTNEKNIGFIQEMLGKLSNEIYSNVGEENKNFIDYVISYKKVTSEEELYQYLDSKFGKKENNNSVEEKAQVFEEKYNNMGCAYCGDSGFKVDVNAFPFQNLSTEKSSGGVGAGFGYITSTIYNNGGIPRSLAGIYNMDTESYTNIWNKNLYSYKPTDKELIKYGDDKRNNEKTLNSNEMSSPDSEVVKALNYYSEKFNNDTRIQKFGWYWNNSFEKRFYIESSTIDNLVKKFKEGKIVNALLLGDGQHVINAYKITEDKNDPDILYIKAYDNNLVNDMFWNADSSKKVKYDVTITLKRVYENTLSGTKTKYTYVYNPIGSDSYKYGTMRSTYDGILFLDGDNKVL